MSFYTALTGLKGAQTDISTTSNNIANVGSNGFKKSRAEFGDIFGSTPLQAKSVGVGTLTKSITQQFSQGNISSSSNSLDMAISGQGFFALQAEGNAAQTVYTRNGAFNVDDNGFIVDSNGQFLLGYPVDDDGAVMDKTLQGSDKLQLDSSFGQPRETSSIQMGVNLPSETAIIAADVVFDAEDPDTYSATSAVTIFDRGGIPQSATVYYIKTQDPSIADPTFKYDTKLFVDGLAITPTLTRAVAAQDAPLFIDKFGNQTTLPTDPAYILEGKGFPLYKSDDLGVAFDSEPATLKGLPVTTHLALGKTVEIVTDPLKFKSTMEYQALQGVANPVAGTFWGKDFLLVDVDGSGPVSVDIPPGTYNGTQLAEAVQTAVRGAFGDDKKVQLTPAVDDAFSIDLKITRGDGTSTGLATGPFVVNLNAASIVAPINSVTAGLEMNTFLQHAQMRVNDTMNAYIQDPADADKLSTAKIDELKVDGRIFKKLVGSVTVPLNAIPTGNDVINIKHSEANATAAAANRFVAYSNNNNKPEVKAYDAKGLMDLTQGYAITGGKTHFSIPKTAFANLADPLKPETVRFMQFGAGTKLFTDGANGFGTKDIAVSNVVVDPGNAANYRVTIVSDKTVLPALAGEAAITVLAKPSDHIAAYFEGTEGLIGGIKEASYTGKIVFQEIGDSAKRLKTQNTTTGLGTDALIVDTLTSTNNINTLGLNAAVISTNWVDDRNSVLQVAYDDAEQRLTFDAKNTALGLGTGLGMNSFTVYSQVLDSGTNGLGIPAFGQTSDVSLATDDKVLGSPFLNDGPELQPNNKRFGIDVKFDTVNNVFDINSGTTGEALAANTALGVTVNQSASSIAIGRYQLTDLGGRDPVDSADYAFNKIGDGKNTILGFPRDGIVGFTEASGLASHPAVATGHEALVDMQNAFSIVELGGENSFNVVVDGVSAFIKVPERNYTGITLATALQDRINAMRHPVSGAPIGGVKVAYNATDNNLSFTTGSTGDGSTIKVKGALKFGLKDVPLGIGDTALVRTPVQATDDLGRPLFVSPTGEITSNTAGFADNIVADFYPLYLDDGELTFNKSGELISPVTSVVYDGLPNAELTVDFSETTQFARPFSAENVSQDGFASGRLTNLEIDNYGSVKAGYSNGSNVTLGKIIIANFSNNSGLKQIGNSTFTATAASGNPELGEAAEDGFGNILSGSLERSNVDITEELVNLITAQRNYQAAAKAMETTTSMTQTIINIRL